LIDRQDLLDAIAECQSVRNPTAQTCIKLAAYYTILEHTTQGYSNNAAPYTSGSEFSDVIFGKDHQDVLRVFDELMETLYVLTPKLYDATIKRLKNADIKG
jgi:hypothetical protein